MYYIYIVFDEDFVFEERPTIIGRRSIEILLYDFDAYSRHVCIGGTKIDLEQIDLSSKVSLWMPLLSCTDQVNIPYLVGAIYAELIYNLCMACVMCV